MAFLEEQFGEWKPVSRGVGIAWLCFYALFLLYAYRDRSGFLVLDYVNLIIHEAGHFFFSWFGETIHILGGTLGELIVPLLCAVYFFWQRETTGFAFSCFWFFENFPYIGAYMADARAGALPLVGSDESDWTILFGQWGLLAQDQEIGATMRIFGWIGMLATVAWLAYRARHDAKKSDLSWLRRICRLATRTLDEPALAPLAPRQRQAFLIALTTLRVPHPAIILRSERLTCCALVMSNRNYWLDLFTGVTWKEFLAAGGDVSGFRESRWSAVQKIKPEDYLLCYLTGISRFIGVLETAAVPFQGLKSDLER